jgi:UDP-glucose 6-dehydrogenase
MPHRVAVIGAGYVGTFAVACLACIGHDLVAVESDNVKLDVLLSGRAVFFKPCLDSLIETGWAAVVAGEGADS